MGLIDAVLDLLHWIPRMARVFGGLIRGDLSLREIADREAGRDFDTSDQDKDADTRPQRPGPRSSDR